MNDLFNKLANTKLLVLLGSGGVGKTTLASSIALHAALRGRKVAILTIDPARRLGAALGFRKLGNRLRTVPASRIDPFRITPGGVMAAAMFDVKSTFDTMIERYAPSPAVRDRITSNPIYIELCRGLSGIHETMALERIYEISSLGEYDLLVLDTPPSAAIDEFLEAPARIRSFLDRDIVGRFFSPSQKGVFKIAQRTLGKGMEWAFALLDRLAGSHVFSEVSSFFSSLEQLLDGLSERVTTVERILHDETTTYFLVATTDPLPWKTAREMNDLLKARKIYPAALLLNRLLPALSNNKTPLRSEETALADFARKILVRQEASLANIRKQFPGLRLYGIELSETDPATLPQLAAIHAAPIR